MPKKHVSVNSLAKKVKNHVVSVLKVLRFGPDSCSGAGWTRNPSWNIAGIPDLQLLPSAFGCGTCHFFTV